jgi:hypothetical protein
MADTKLTALTEYDALPAAADLLYMVDVSDTTDDPTGTNFKVKAQRFAVTDGNIVNFTGGGTIALGGFTLTAAQTGTIADLTTAQTFTNKTLTTPTIADLTNMTHDHTNAAGGGSNLHFFQFINIFSADTGGLGETDTSYDDDWEHDTSFYINKSHLATDATVIFHAWLVAGASHTASIELYNATTAAAVTGSELTHNTATNTLKSSGDLYANLAAGLNRYYVRLKSSDGTGVSSSKQSVVIDW